VVDNPSPDGAMRVLVGAGGRIVSVVDVVASAASGKNVVTTVVDIEDDTVTSLETAAGSAIVNRLDALEAETADTVGSSPHDVATISITTVVLEPAVHLGGIATPATIGTVHGNRGHGTASTADGVTASAELVAAPLGIALSPDRSLDSNSVVGLSDSKSCKSNKKDETHF